MSGAQEVRQVQDRQVAASDDDLALMDYTDPEKDPESAAEEAGTQTDLGRRRCRRRKLMRKQMETEDDDCHFRSHHHEKKMMKKMAKKWMRKMMWRRMMFRMCYGGGPFGMSPGFGCRRRMRMMTAASMMDTTTDSSSSESGERGAGWRHRRCCRRRRFGRRFGDGKRPEDESIEKGKEQNAEAQVQNSGETGQSIISPSSKDPVTVQTTSTENTADQTNKSSASGRIRDRNVRGREHKKWKCMRRVRFCDISSGESSSDSSSSSSESSCDENEGPQEISKSKERGGRRCRRGGRRHLEQEQTVAEGKEDERGDKCTKGRKAWRGKKFHKRMMKRMDRKGRFMGFY